MADAESITFTSEQHRGVGTTFDCRHAHRPVPHERPHDRHRVGAGPGHGHRAPRPVHRYRPLHARTRSAPDARASRGPRRSDFPWWMGGAGRRARARSRSCAACGAANLAARCARPRSIPRMTNLAVSVAGLQTLGAPMSLDVAREADDARLRVGLGRGGQRRRGDVAARRDQPGRAARRARHRRARAAAAHAAACTRWPAATLQQLAGDRDVFLGIGISSPAVAGQWHGAGYGDRPIAQVREFVALAPRVPVAARP